MSKIDYQALRAKAEKATCGVWSLEYVESRFDCDDALIHREAAGYIPICRIEGAHPESGFDEDFQMEQQANAEFIAAANPATVLELLDELEAAEKRIAELEALEVVPDEMTPKQASRSYCGEVRGYRDGWNACRSKVIGNMLLVDMDRTATDNTNQQFESLSNHKHHFINGTCDNSRSSAKAGGRMSRVNGRKPHKYMPVMSSAKPVKLTYGQIKALPLMSDVYVRMNDGKILNGKLVSHSDYLVGCPVVDIGESRSIGIGYEGEIIAAAPKQEDL